MHMCVFVGIRAYVVWTSVHVCLYVVCVFFLTWKLVSFMQLGNPTSWSVKKNVTLASDPTVPSPWLPLLQRAG